MVNPGAFVVAWLLIIGAQLCAGKPLRGLNPELSKFYVPGEKFTCLDKSLVIPFDQVNDNYCDCTDGSDEPGTSACPNGSFYCRNRGHEPRFLGSPFVDDGVCDCCDGTDEPIGKCTNKCVEHSAGARESVRKQLQEYEAALQVKQSYVDQAASLRESMLSRLQQLATEIESQTVVVNQLQDEVDRLGPEASKLPPAEAQPAEQPQDNVPSEAQAQPEPQELQAGHTEEVLEGNNRELQNAEEAEDDNSAEAIGRRIASQWTKDPDAAEVPAASHDENAPTEPDDWENHDDAAHEEYEHHPPEDDEPHEAELSAASPSEGRILTPAQQLSHAKSQLSRLTKEKEDLDKQVTYDYGLQDEFLALRSRCLQSNEVKYTYEACMFGAAHQIEGHSRTKLGVWKGFENDYSEAVFDNGDYCWNAPNRSLRLTMTCSSTDEVYGVDEPSRCVYTGKMKTPAVCNQAGADKIRAQLAEMVRLEEELKKEIAADEEAARQGQATYDEL